MMDEIIMTLKIGYGFFLLSKIFLENGIEPSQAVSNLTENAIRTTLESIIGPIDDTEILKDVTLYLEGLSKNRE